MTVSDGGIWQALRWQLEALAGELVSPYFRHASKPSRTQQVQIHSKIWGRDQGLSLCRFGCQRVDLDLQFAFSDMEIPNGNLFLATSCLFIIVSELPWQRCDYSSSLPPL